MRMTLEEAIKHCEEKAEKLERRAEEVAMNDAEGVYQPQVARCRDCASDHRQLADWLKELKESRIVLDILGQFLADMGIDVCCEDLIMIDDYCEKYCDNQKPLCWYRWAKMKAREVNADENKT